MGEGVRSPGGLAGEARGQVGKRLGSRRRWDLEGGEKPGAGLGGKARGQVEGTGKRGGWREKRGAGSWPAGEK